MKRINLLIAIFASFLQLSPSKKERTPYLTPIEFVVVIASYNNELYCEDNLKTVISQKVDAPFEIIYINDCSTDKTGQKVEDYVKKHDLGSKVTIIHNEKRMGVLANHYHAIHSVPDHKIIVTYDGDDYYPHEHVLARIKKEYEDGKTWMTYGQYAYYPEGWIGVCEEIPQEIFAKGQIRTYKWVTSQQRTFYAGLFKKIKKEDLLYQGEFFPSAGDVAMMYPMLEMACEGHIRFIPDVIYLYNHHNPLCDHRIDRNFQLNLNVELCRRKPYKPLKTIFDIIE